MLDCSRRSRKLQRSCICDAEPHLTHYMLDQGGCGYNNFEYVSNAKLKEITIFKMYACILPLYHCFSLLLFKMPRVSLETRRMIVAISKSGYSVQDIQNRLAEENIYTSKISIYKILSKYQHHRLTL